MRMYIRLRDCESSAKSNELDRHEDPDGEAATNALQRLRSRSQGFVFAKEEDFERDTVPFQSLNTHYEEKTSQYALWDKMQDYEQRASHGAECEDALGEV